LLLGRVQAGYNIWVIDITELVNGDKFDVNILDVSRDEGDLESTNGGGVVLALDVA